MWEAIDQYEEIPVSGWDELSGRKKWKSILSGFASVHKDKFINGEKRAFLFWGRAGSGKYTLAAAFASEMEKQGYAFLNFYAEDLKGETEGETAAYLKELEQGIMNREKTFVLLQNLEELCTGRISLILAGLLRRLADKNKQVVFAALAENIFEIPPVLCSKFIICAISDPLKEERKEYFEKEFQDILLEKGLTLQKIVRETEGFSFAELRDVVFFAKFMISDLKTGRLLEEIMEEAVRLAGVIKVKASFAEASDMEIPLMQMSQSSGQFLPCTQMDIKLVEKKQEESEKTSEIPQIEVKKTDLLDKNAGINDILNMKIE